MKLAQIRENVIVAEPSQIFGRIRNIVRPQYDRSGRRINNRNRPKRKNVLKTARSLVSNGQSGQKRP